MAQQLQELQQNQSVCIQLNPGQPTWQTSTVTRSPTKRITRAYKVETSSGDQCTRNRRFIHPAVEPVSPGPATPEVPVALSILQKDRPLSPTQAPLVHSPHPGPPHHPAMSLTPLETDRGDALIQ